MLLLAIFLINLFSPNQIDQKNNFKVKLWQLNFEIMPESFEVIRSMLRLN